MDEAVRLHDRTVSRQAEGRLQEALPLCRRALTIFERVYGPDHYEVAVTCNNLAALSHAKGDEVDAEQLYRRGLALFEAALGCNHPKMLSCRQNYAQLQRDRRRQAKAAALEGYGKRAQTSRARYAKKE